MNAVVEWPIASDCESMSSQNSHLPGRAANDSAELNEMGREEINTAPVKIVSHCVLAPFAVCYHSTPARTSFEFETDLPNEYGPARVRFEFQ